MEEASFKNNRITQKLFLKIYQLRCILALLKAFRFSIPNITF